MRAAELQRGIIRRDERRGEEGAVPRHDAAVESEAALAGDGRAGGVRRVEAAGGDDAERRGGTAPLELRHRGRLRGKILDGERVELPGVQCGGQAHERGRLLPPLVHDLPVAEPHAHAVVGFEVEGVVLRVLGLDLAGPAHGEVFRRHAGRGGLVGPVEIHLRVEALEQFAGAVGTGEVSAKQAVLRLACARLGRARGREHVGGDGDFALRRAAPEEAHLRLFARAEVFEAEVVALPGGERDDGAVELAGRVAPLVEDELAVEPQARAAAGLDVEGVALGELRGDLAAPPDAERLCGQLGHRRVLAPVEIQLWVNAREGAAAVEFRAAVVSGEQALRGRGDAGLRADGGVKLAARDEALRNAGAGPREAQAGGAEVVVVFEAEVVALAGGQVEVAGDFRAVSHAPGVADKFVAEPEARAVVGVEMEGELAGDGRFELSGPARAEVILLHAGNRLAHFPVEVDRLVEAMDRPPAQVHALVVGAEQAVAPALHQRGDLGWEGAGGAAGEGGLVEIGEEELLLRAVGEGDFDPGGRVELDGAFEELAIAGAEGTGRCAG